MKTLQTVRMKPNPAGKDRMRYGASETQLGAEWADIKNVGAGPVDLEGVRLCHIAYAGDGRSSTWQVVMSFRGTLGAGQTMRIHTGKGPASVLRAEDLQGADFHLFTGHDNYVGNNDRGDCASLWEPGASSPFDKACYDPWPPEGAVLHRVGEKLVSVAMRASRYQ